MPATISTQLAPLPTIQISATTPCRRRCRPWRVGEGAAGWGNGSLHYWRIVSFAITEI